MKLRRTVWLVVLPFVTSLAPGSPDSAGAQAAKRWDFGVYRQFSTPAAPSSSGVTTRALGGSLKVSRVAVQRPQVAPGETTNLIAEYEVAAAEPTVEVRETRVIRFEGQQVAKLEKVVSLSRGSCGTTVALMVPPDAAPGLYTVTTSVGPVSALDTRGAAGHDRATSMFRVEPAAPAATAPAVAAAGAPFKLWTDTKTRKIGEALKVSFQADRDGYVTLVNVGTSGKTTILFPNVYAPNHAVKAGQTYSVPGPDDPYELTLSGPEGVELVYALFTTAPTRFVEESFVKSRPFAPLAERTEPVTRDISLALKKIPLKEQATAALEIEVTR
jgi:hypothetical protein